MNQYAACPKCSVSDAKPVSFTWWGGVIGPKLLNHVKCQNCKKAYDGKTGKDNASNIAIYFLVTFVAVFVLFAGIGFLLALN